jgi:argininosuccinate synthase
LKKVLVGCVGSDDLQVIQQLSMNHEVVAVVFDLGAGAGMRELHDQACAAGANRCHVLDVGDEYVRACVLPAIDDGVVSERARSFIARKLGDIARLEGPCRIIEPATPVGRTARGYHGAVDCSAVVSIAFEERVPVAINDIPMTLSEVVDCLTTLGGVHGLSAGASAEAGFARGEPAMHILQAAHRQLEDRSSGVARLELHAGTIRTCNAAFATT